MRKIKAIRKLAHILFATAVFFLLLHNITPHLHHDELGKEMDCEEDEAPEGILDWLTRSFHIDLGEGHLEYFPKVHKTDVDSELQEFLTDSLQTSFAATRTLSQAIILPVFPKLDSKEKSSSSRCTTSYSLRGPPLNV